MSKLPQTNFYQNIRAILENARQKVAISVNSAMIEAYWQIGRMIVEEEQNGANRAIYGDYLVPRLSEQLTKDFGKGFNKRNLFYMKQFYLAFPIVNAVRSQLSWTHYRLLTKVKNEKARVFYQTEADTLNKFDFRSAFYGILINLSSSILYDSAPLFWTTAKNIFGSFFGINNPALIT